LELKEQVCALNVYREIADIVYVSTLYFENILSRSCNRFS